MSRGQKSDLRPVKLHLSLPKDVSDWIESMVQANPYCATRQDFIVGKLTEVMKKENPQGVLELTS